MNIRDHLPYLRKAIQVSQQAREAGNLPFGAILVDAEGQILLEQPNVQVTDANCAGHAEMMLMIEASKRYSPAFLWTCTMYASTEPCPMCAGAIYWGNLGHVVFALAGKQVDEMTKDPAQRIGLDLPCRDVLARGRKNIVVEGPFPELEAEAAGAHEGFWNQ